jgi:dTDP-D-glucose 4,6-dehydratase
MLNQSLPEMIAELLRENELLKQQLEEARSYAKDKETEVKYYRGIMREAQDLAERLKKEMGFTGEIVWNTEKPNGTPRRKMDNSKLRSLGWSPKVTFDEGLKRTITWYKQQKGLK